MYGQGIKGVAAWLSRLNPAMKLLRVIPAITLAVAQNAEASPVVGFPPSPNPAGSEVGVRSPYAGSESWQVSSSHSSSVRESMRDRRRPVNSGSHTHHRHSSTHTGAHYHPSHSDRPHSPSTSLNADTDDGVEIDIVPGGWTNSTGDHGLRVPTAESHPIASPSSDGVGTEPPSKDGWRDASMTWYNGSVLEE